MPLLSVPEQEVCEYSQYSIIGMHVLQEQFGGLLFLFEQEITNIGKQCGHEGILTQGKRYIQSLRLFSLRHAFYEHFSVSCAGLSYRGCLPSFKKGELQGRARPDSGGAQT